MQDIVQKVDRVKAIFADSRERGGGRGPSPEQIAELGEIAVDVVAELVANSRRIAVALESIAGDASHFVGGARV